MTKTLLALILIAFPFFLQAQNWELMNAREVYTYSINGDTAPVLAQLALRAHSVAGIDSFELNTQKDDNQTSCTNSGLPGYFFNKPFFMQRYAIHHADSSWLFSTPEKLVIYPKADSGFVWLFDTLHNITAQIVAVKDSMLWGQHDSIKIIHLDSAGSIRQLIVSRKNGILKWPAGNGSYYTLCGLGKSRIGRFYPTMMDYYDWHIGDIYVYSQVYNDLMGYDDQNQYVKITDRHDYPDSLVFSVSYYKWGSSTNFPNYHYHKNTTLKITPSGNIIYSAPFHAAESGPCFNPFWNKTWLDATPPVPGALAIDDTYFSSLIPHSTTAAIHFSPAMDSIYSIVMDTISNSAIKWVLEDCPTKGSFIYPGSEDFNFIYKKGKGITYSEGSHFESYEHCILSGYIKDGQSWGNVPSDSTLLHLAVNTFASHPLNFHISPNPAHSSVNIQWTATNAPVETLFVQLTDLTGRIVKEQIITDSHTNQLTITVNDLPAGVYCVQLIANGKEAYTEKLIID